ncbi:MAG: hypothetical protein KAJ93_02265 [Methanosarcinales archaeon]|nr:hypothetical protein [Methanosarcinales archaeon]
MATDDNKQPYSGKKFKAALMLSEGIKTQKEIAAEVNTTTVTISRWKQEPEYKAYIDQLTLENDMASRAGMLRALYKGASLKEKNIKEDKSTHLDYMKGIAKVQGLESQKVEISGEVSIKKIEITTSKREDAD